MSDASVVSGITEEVKGRVDEAASAVKTLGGSAIETPGQAVQIAATALSGGGAVAGQSFEDIVDALKDKINDCLDALNHLAHVVTG